MPYDASKLYKSPFDSKCASEPKNPRSLVQTQVNAEWKEASKKFKKGTEEFLECIESKIASYNTIAAQKKYAASILKFMTPEATKPKVSVCFLFLYTLNVFVQFRADYFCKIKPLLHLHDFVLIICTIFRFVRKFAQKVCV